QHLRCEGDDLHVLLVTQFTGDRPEDTGPSRLAVLDEDGGVLVELDVRTVRAAALLHGAHDDSLDDIALLHAGPGDGLLDGGHDRVADTGIASAGAAQHPDAQNLARTGVVGDLQPRLLLNHVPISLLGLLKDLDDPPALRL